MATNDEVQAAIDCLKDTTCEEDVFDGVKEIVQQHREKYPKETKHCQDATV